MSHADSIRQLLLRKPGLKAHEIAGELGFERSDVVAALHGPLGSAVNQDNAYRWWPRAPATLPPAGGVSSPPTFLASLCRYYLECLARESGSGISIPAADSGSYVVLNALPFAAEGDEPWGPSRQVRKIVQKVRRERGQLTLYVGYAVRIRSAFSRNDEDRRIEPVLLYPVEEAPDDRAAPLRPAGSIPLFNLEVLKSLPSADSGNLIDEVTHLSEELGLANADGDLPQWGEIVLRLQHRRPEWGWREDLNPYCLSSDPPLTGLTAPGIYNRAVLFAGTRSPFTYGLETELRKLMQLDDEAVRDTALGQWLSGAAIEAPLAEDRPILEVVPLNNEQRQAVVQGLSAPLTVVTGPPGTGKSQVVSALLANMAWLQQSVLFSSKNNHAVDVVESRANELGPSPLLLRLGREEHHARIAQHLGSGLAESASADAAAGYAWLVRAHEQDRARYAAVQDEIALVVSVRNEVDELERAAEPARALFGEQRFAALRAADVDAIGLRVESFANALVAVSASRRPAVTRLLRDSGNAGGSAWPSSPARCVPMPPHLASSRPTPFRPRTISRPGRSFSAYSLTASRGPLAPATTAAPSIAYAPPPPSSAWPVN